MPDTIETPTMTDFTATMAVEGMWDMAGMEATDENYIAACQHLIDTGLSDTLQGSFGRACQKMILEGHCHPRGWGEVDT